MIFVKLNRTAVVVVVAVVFSFYPISVISAISAQGINKPSPLNLLF